MVIKYFTKPFFLAAVICAFIFYSGLFKIPEKNKLKSLICEDDVCFIQLRLLSSPSKCENEKFYGATGFALYAESGGGVKSSASGKVKVYIPSESVETFFPGKLYSSSQKKGSFLYETGGIYSLNGKFKNNAFYVSKCESVFWENSTNGKICKFRALCRLQFKRLMYSWGEAGGLLLALLSGAREYTEKKTSDAFRLAGLSHILALSGMHLSMFSAIAVFCGDKLGRKKLTYLIRILVLILFVWFAGFSPSLLRAFICALLSLIATMSGTEKPDMILILCFSFLFQSFICPGDIQNAGFILSYGALAGILLTNSFLNRILSKIFPKMLAASFSSSTGAQIFTAPVSLKLFGTFSPIGIIATTVVSPLITLFIYSGLILIILSLIFPIIQIYSGFFVNILYTVIKFLVNFFSKIPSLKLHDEESFDFRGE